jgi:hypothetical protein
MNFVIDVLDGSCILVLVLLVLVLIHDIVQIVCNMSVAFNIFI